MRQAYGSRSLMVGGILRSASALIECMLIDAIKLGNSVVPLLWNAMMP